MKQPHEIQLTDEITLADALEKHAAWLANKRAGKRLVLTGANLRGADLTGADLRGADLRGADLIDANLRGADLRGADLIDANLRGANLIDADLRGADLRGADLTGANLIDADLTDAKDIWGFTLGKHFAFFQPSSKYLKIGCIGNLLDWWLKHYNAVGRRENYNADEITRYGAMIQLLAEMVKENDPVHHD